MQWWEAIFLGVIQGLTEFLPVSSDGHLVLAERVLQLQDHPLTFDIMLHAGTLVVMVIYFWKQIRALRRQDWLTLALASIPVVVLGIAIREHIPTLQSSRWVVSGSFLATALSLWLADQIWQPSAIAKKNPVRWFNWAVERFDRWHAKRFASDSLAVSRWQALGVGLFQATALLPGLSRSGSTLLGGAVVGLRRDQAFPFAFIVGVPAIAGAVIYDFLVVAQSGELGAHPWDLYLLGAVSAAVTGWVALKILSYVMVHSRLTYFAAYCLVVSILSMFLL